MNHPDGDKEALASLCYLVWCIWLGRNRCMFSCKAPKPVEKVFYARSLAKEFCTALNCSTGVRGGSIKIPVK